MKHLFIFFNLLFYKYVAKYTGILGLKILLLTTVGAKTGKTRQTPLAWFPSEKNGWILVASAGGAAKDPAWYFNLTKNPDNVWIEVKDKKYHVKPTTLHRDAREKEWEKIVATAPLYAHYKNSTKRQIPIVLLQEIK
jgi:deazaflavin-dependent oxidoreductase (nitroreductase family)